MDLAQPLGHRLDRLAAAVQQQPAQVALPAGALIGAWQRFEDVVSERFQPPANRGQLGRCEAPHSSPPRSDLGKRHPTSYPAANLTEP